MTTTQDKVNQVKAGLLRLRHRIAELEALKPKMIVDYKRDLKPIEQSIEETLAETFGAASSQYKRYSGATKLFDKPLLSYTQAYLCESAARRVAASIGLLRQAETQLAEELGVLEVTPPYAPRPTVHTPVKPCAFIVHGHDEQSRAEVVRFLDGIGIEAIVLHEQANQGRTIIEKIEDYANVNFAIILFTPDDVGGRPSEAMKPRARQNVILELGYFLGRLGRERVCALKMGEIELPSDIFGIVWQSLDTGRTWKQMLAKELEAAGYNVDWRKVASLLSG